MVNLGLLALQLALMVACAPLVQGAIKASKAGWQNRRGPGLAQAWWDIAKWLGRESVVSQHASWVYRWAPPLYLGAMLAAAGLVPTLAVAPPLAPLGDALTVVGLFALARFALALAALDTASNFGGMGTARELMFAALVEPALLLGLFAVAVPFGTTDFATLTAGASLDVAHLLAAGCLFIAAIAETGRIPVDNPDTHLELTMAHEGMILEYSGRPLGMLFLGAHLRQLTLLSLLVALFLPAGAAADSSPASLALGVAAWLVKVTLVGLLMGLVESNYAKRRIFKAPELLGTAGVLGLLAVVAGAAGGVH